MNHLLFFGFALLLVLAPLPLGSNREWSWTLLSVGLGVLGLGWGVIALATPGRVSLDLPRGLPLLFAAVLAWAAVQALTNTPPAWHHPLWALNGELLGDRMAGLSAVSLAPDDGWTALMRLLGYGLAFFLAFQLCRDVRRARWLFRVLAGVGFAVAVYGLVRYFGGTDNFLGFWTLEQTGSVHGTFVNRNHFATWLGLCLLCLVALFHEALAVKRRNPAYRLPVQREVRLEQFLARAWPYLAGLILMTGALILTHSRGGFLATLAGGAVLLLALNHRQPIGSLRTRAVLFATLAFTIATFFITSSILLERFDQSTAGMDGRLQAFELTTEGIEDNPLMGFGYGTYADSFRLYRSEQLDGYYHRAHNTYLENLFELGWPAALALFACVAWIGWICLRGTRHRGRHWVYPATGLAATVLIATHALVDFSVQIPAIALTYTALSGAACAQAFSSRA
ncbi:MAG: O-antigen ligase family protein [Xanthomonadales bacterium]|jgi:O-antigen ligase|nr:O-antigen ligase family protein [Xanthomonadales bacterium]